MLTNYIHKHTNVHTHTHTHPAVLTRDIPAAEGGIYVSLGTHLKHGQKKNYIIIINSPFNILLGDT